MEYITIAMDFLAKHDYVIMGVLLALVLAFGVANLFHNPYRRQNKRLNRCRKKILAYPTKVSKQMESLTEEYRRQWRAYTRSGADRPSQVFEFVKIKNKLVLTRLYALTALLSLTFVLSYFLGSGRNDYLIFQGVIWLVFFVFLFASRVTYNLYERKAKHIFGKFVNELNRQTTLNNIDAGSAVERVVRGLNELNGKDVTRATLARASELLRKKGLDSDRSVVEQQKINSALNSLLQAYARSAQLQQEAQ